MKRKNTRGWLVVLAALMLGGALAAPQAAFAGDKKGKDGKIPIVVGKPIVTPDPKTPEPPKKK